jgi:hypothetical protein
MQNEEDLHISSINDRQLIIQTKKRRKNLLLFPGGKILKIKYDKVILEE